MAGLVVLARRAEVFAELANVLPRNHAAQRHGFLVADVADTEALRRQAGELAATDPVHILVNNSGGPPPGDIADAEPSAFLDAYRRHLLASHTLVQAVLPGMRAAGWGRIVNVISTSVKEPIAGIGVSNATRGAVANWAKTLAGEVAVDGITVNNVLPGATDTPRIAQIVAAKAQATGRSVHDVRQAMAAAIPMARFADPAETAAAVAFLASPAASYITGINLPVDGGRTRSL
jgi:3-oxoacyl-[acyl-carrier protein] reductase